MTELEEARSFFIKDTYAMVTTGIDIDEVGEHYAKCSLKLDDRHRNATGHVMGGVLFTLADFVFAVAANFRQPVTVTTVSQISYLGTAKGDILYGESRLLKDGRRNCFYQIDITDNMGTEIAVVSVSGVHLSQ
ncbi:MAG: PaaI family thioesterase [Lachnospiraceae bacterium]|nr:PaaI family thioesterase [Lachnospiraceae bacterium]MDE6625546.1 PaaI family thioesterase [Lachnospiraceae bacterium]